MVNGSVSATPPWVTRSLWAISASLAVAILTVRGHGIAGDVESDPGPNRTAALATFSAPVANKSLPHAFDGVEWSGHAPLPIRGANPVAVPARTIITLSGWAFDEPRGKPFQTIAARADGRGLPAAAVENLRPDVASALHVAAAERSGFSLAWDTSRLSAGRHRIEVRALAFDGKTAYVLAPAIGIDVGAAAAVSQTTDAIDAVNGVAIGTPSDRPRMVHVLREYPSITLNGWGFATDGRRIPRGATLLMDGKSAAKAHYGLPRPDVASLFHDVRYLRSGFVAALPITHINPGQHTFRFRLELANGDSVETAQSVTIDLR